MTATGVDAAPYLTFLRTHRCNFAEGKLISPPLWFQKLPTRLRAKAQS